MKPKYKYVCEGVKFMTLWAATDWANRIFQRTGNTVAVEAIPEEEPTPPPGYTAEELERDNPFNQWMYES